MPGLPDLRVHLGQRLRDHRNRPRPAACRCRPGSPSRPCPLVVGLRQRPDVRTDGRRLDEDLGVVERRIPVGAGRLARIGHQPTSLRSSAYCSPSANRSRSSAAGFVATSAADGGRLGAAPTDDRQRGRRDVAGQHQPQPIRGAQHALVPGGEIVLLEVEARRLQRERLPLLAPDGARDRAQQTRPTASGARRAARRRPAMRRSRTAARARRDRRARARSRAAPGCRARARPGSGWRANSPRRPRAAAPARAPRARPPARCPARA